MKNELMAHLVFTKEEAETLSFGLEEMGASNSVPDCHQHLVVVIQGLNYLFVMRPTESVLPIIVTEDEAQLLEAATRWASSHAYHKYGPAAGAEIVAHLRAKLVIAIADINGQKAPGDSNV